MRAVLAMADTSPALVRVYVMYGWNRLVGLSAGTILSGSKRANERRERLTKNSYHDPVRGERRAGRPSQARSGDTPTTRGGEDSPESIARTIPTAYKPLSDARATPWPRVEPGTSTCAKRVPAV